MNRFPFISAPHTKTLLRVAIGLIMVSHGIARLSLGTVNEFGELLDIKGLPAGVFIAWTVTILEILAGLILASGHLVRIICLWFILQHIFGIILIHAGNGWFVVGSQTGGIEFSALLIVCLIVIAANHKKTP
ncbi:DoxX family protein [Ferruginibacter sp. SUN106]|uniref:DoxX family protein n=1 Tax=Ferruginibacter sp. SUN106 TaxID=2978348 RepID=UPI003D35C25D